MTATSDSDIASEGVRVDWRMVLMIGGGFYESEKGLLAWRRIFMHWKGSLCIGRGPYASEGVF